MTTEINTAGDGGTAVIGSYGAAVAGDHGTATAGFCGSAVVGRHGTATTGAYGMATAGYSSHAIAGDYGFASAGYKGTATAGHEGTICISWLDDNGRHRAAIGYIGEDGLRPGIAYALDDNGNFKEAQS